MSLMSEARATRSFFITDWTGGRVGDTSGATMAASTSFATGVERRTTEDVAAGAGAGRPTG
jgi:hypothetical protein